MSCWQDWSYFVCSDDLNKSDSEIIEEYIKLFSLLDDSYNVPFNDKYKEFIDECKTELIIIHKRNIAAKTLKQCIKQIKPHVQMIIYIWTYWTRWWFETIFKFMISTTK